jgi:hypothetical protein
MVRALRDGRKTQTRRVLKLPTKTHAGGPIYERPDMGGWAVTTHGGEGVFAIDTDGQRYTPPERAGLWHQTTGTCVAATFAIGDRLWVKETWAVASVFTDVVEVRYRASERRAHSEFVEQVPIERATKYAPTWPTWKPSIFMQRWASRLTLTVTDVRVERLQDCSEADAEAEGCVWDSADGHDVWYVPGAKMQRNGATARECYSLLWNSIHGPGSWEANPWVVAVSFDVRKGNIDV